MKTTIKVNANSDENASFDSSKHSVVINSSTSSERYTFSDLTEARLHLPVID